MLTIVENNESIPNAYLESIQSLIGEFNEHAKSIKTYNIDQDPSNFQIRNRIITQIQNWYQFVFRGHDNNRKVNNYLQVYNSLKILNLISLEKSKSQIDKLIRDTNDTDKKAQEILKLLQVKASAESVQEYSSIFKNQALRHSNFAFKIKPFHFKLGNAEYWLIISILLILGFAYFIFNVNTIFPIDLNQKTSIVTVELITRLLIISFVIYLVTFSFKQFNIQKHLHTLNKHRQNTLNSFKLFIESLDQGDTVTRNALMMEVAKAIYEAGQSGYISSKDGGESAPSIIEMTRYMNQK